MRHSPWADQHHFGNGSCTGRVHSKGRAVVYAGGRTRIYRSRPEVVPREIALVRSVLSRLPSARDVLIATHEDAAIGQQNRGGMVAARVLHGSAGHPSCGQVLGVQYLSRATDVGNTAGKKHPRVRHQYRIHLVHSWLIEV